MNKKQRQKKKQINRLKKDILKGKIDVSFLDKQIAEVPIIKRSIEETQTPKKKSKIRKSQISQLKKLSSYELLEKNDKQLSFQQKKQRKKKRKQKKAKGYKVKQGARVAFSEHEVDEMHPKVSIDTVASSPLIAVQRVRQLCKDYSGTYIMGRNADFLLVYFNSTVQLYGDDEVGNALLGMQDDYITSVQMIIFESKQDISQKMVYHFIDMLVELAGNKEDFWSIQEFVVDNLASE